MRFLEASQACRGCREKATLDSMTSLTTVLLIGNICSLFVKTPSLLIYPKLGFDLCYVNPLYSYRIYKNIQNIFSRQRTFHIWSPELHIVVFPWQAMYIYSNWYHVVILQFIFWCPFAWMFSFISWNAWWLQLSQCRLTLLSEWKAFDWPSLLSVSVCFNGWGELCSDRDCFIALTVFMGSGQDREQSSENTG